MGEFENLKMKKKVQIIGKVTGLNRIDVVLKFKEAQNHLEAQGYEVINPVVLVPADATHAKAMRMCLDSILTVDAVAMLPDWVHSTGSQVEYQNAFILGLNMIWL